MALDRLPAEVFLQLILPYLCDNLSILSQFSLACKAFHQLLFQPSAADLWDNANRHQPVKVCIDGYCPTCNVAFHAVKVNPSGNNSFSLTKSPRDQTSHAFQFLSTCPLRSILLHCFITDIPKALKALSHQHALHSLELSLTNKTTSPPLDTLLSEKSMRSIHSTDSFINLKELTLNSSHLLHVKLGGRARLLDLLGRQLKVLKFVNLSPSGVFSILPTRCPGLTSLRVDKALSVSDLEGYHNEVLLELDLYRCSFIPSKASLSHFPALIKVKFSALFRMEEIQVKSLVAAMPSRVKSLTLEVPSLLADVAVSYISRGLRCLEELVLEGSYEKVL